MIKSDVCAGFELPTVTHLVTRENIVRYGRLVTGFNPLHDDDEFAKELGFEKIVAHGVLHLNYISEMLCCYAGHPNRVKKIYIDFVKAVYPGDVITARGVVREVREEGSSMRIVIDVWSENQDGVRVMDRGTAEIESGS